MPLRDDIFEPIPGDNPCGKDLYYDPLFEEIKEARKQETEDPLAGWEEAARNADHAKVIKLGEDALVTKTKDLRLAQWVAEALIYKEGFAGLVEGIKLFHGLIEKFWDEGLYPTYEDPEDVEIRAAPLEWFGNYFAPDKGPSPCLALRYVALTKGGKGWMKYKESRAVPYESDSEKAKERKEAVEEGKMPPEEFDSDFDGTPKPFYKKAFADVKAATESLKALESLCDEKFGEFTPSFRELSKALEEITLSVDALLKKKLEQDPDPIEVAEPAEGAEEGEAAEGEAGAAAAPGIVRLKSSEELAALLPADASEAVNRILAVAQFLRSREPQSPVPYLMLRALRWGELRAQSNGEGGIDPGFLQAPSAEVRVALKRSAGGANWRQVLETAEGAMGEPCGRGWLDLQRYSIKACQELGFGAAAAAMLSELKTLLSDVPSLPEMTLSDDTGAANPETRKWLAETVLGQTEGEG